MSDGAKTGTKFTIGAIVAVAIFIAGALADLFTERGGVIADMSTVKKSITTIKERHESLHEEVADLRGRFDRDFSSMKADVEWIKRYLQKQAPVP